MKAQGLPNICLHAQDLLVRVVVYLLSQWRLLKQLSSNTAFQSKSIGTCLIFTCCLLAASSLPAQQTLHLTEPASIFNKGIDLYQQGYYSNAREQFESYIRLNLQDGRQVEAEYYVCMCAMKLSSPDFDFLLENFVSKYPDHFLTRNIYRTIGLTYYNKGIYTEATQYLQRAYGSNGNPEQDAELAFKLAYSYFAEKNYSSAQTIFNLLKSGSSQYATAASYYAGYIAFQEKRYREALSDLERAAADKHYAEAANALIFAIHYLEGDYKRLVAFAEQLERKNKKLPNYLLAPLADAYYLMNRCQKALPLLENLARQSRADRTLFYRLGHCYMQEKQYQLAVEMFAKVAEGTDSLGQMAAYHMGASLIELKQLQAATNAFRHARNLPLDQRLRELSAYNLIKAHFELRNYAEAIESASFYEQHFPKGEYLEEVRYLKSEAFISGGNYSGALRYLEQLPHPTERMLLAYQRIALNYAAILYNEEKFPQAVAILYRSLQRPQDEELVYTAYLWIGESLYRQDKLDSAEIAYGRVIPIAKEYPNAIYGLGYIAFNKENYPQAERLFQQLLSLNANINRADVQTRLADCRYIARDFTRAITLYQQALTMSGADGDYINYQIAQCYVGLQRRDEAIGLLDRILASRLSRMAAPAAFLKAELQFEAGKKDLALQSYSQLIQQYPNSELVPDALFKRGLAYSILGQAQQAISDYKAILDRFPTHPKAAEAIESLQEMENNGIPVPDFDRYLQSFASNNPNSQATAQIEFNRARVPYDNGDYANAVRTLTEFLNRHPTSPMTEEARFMLVVSMDQTGDKQNALAQYNQVRGSNAIRAGLRAAEIELELGQVQAAYNRYRSLQHQVNDNRNWARVMIGLIRSSFQLGQLNQTEHFCNEVISRNLTVAGARGIAELHLGKIMLERGQLEQALHQFRRVANTYTDASGAEAQFRLGETLRIQKNYNASTEELVKMKNLFEHHPEWVYEAFLLVAENYIDLNNLFQARATLNSIIENSKDEAIRQRARKRLQEI